MLKAIVEVAVARKLLDLASMGERDPERLRKAALRKYRSSPPLRMRAGTTVLARSLRGAFTVPVQSETSKLDRLRSEILAAARCADLAAMHDAIVAYHQLLGIEEGEPDSIAQALASSGPRTNRSVRASRSPKF